jgi:hypothetical protein
MVDLDAAGRVVQCGRCSPQDTSSASSTSGRQNDVEREFGRPMVDRVAQLDGA